MSGYARPLIRRRRWHRPLAPCKGLRDSACVATRRLRTANYSEQARKRLADAIGAAREAAGYTTTSQLIRAIGRGSRAIYALEAGEPTVGQSVLQAVGRKLGERLPGWTEDTPRLILEGGDPPDLGAPAGAIEEAAASLPDPPILTALEAEMYRELLYFSERLERDDYQRLKRLLETFKQVMAAESVTDSGVQSSAQS